VENFAFLVAQKGLKPHQNAPSPREARIDNERTPEMAGSRSKGFKYGGQTASQELARRRAEEKSPGFNRRADAQAKRVNAEIKRQGAEARRAAAEKREGKGSTTRRRAQMGKVGRE
jgi:hypothetical protein